jgi:putative SOS response-associated peptidase YedK
MCGKVRAKKNWQASVSPDAAMDAGDNVTYRVMNDLPVIVFDGGQRYVMPIRWGFPDPADWRRPRPIHARGETIDTTPAFARAFRDGQRGILLLESFNEAPESGEQHTVTTAGPVGIAMLWRRFAVENGTLLACVMVTVPANVLLSRLPTDRMPAVLAPSDWAIWLGENNATPEMAKACLKTVEDLRWTMTREERAASNRRARPTVADPVGLF